MRRFLDMEGSVELSGEHYRASGAKPGPAPRPSDRPLAGRLQAADAPSHRPLGGWLAAERVAGLAERHRFDALFVSVPEADPLGYIGRLGETAAALRF